MRKRQLVLTASLLLSCALAVPTLAQTPSGNVAQVFVNVPKPGMRNQYEAGRKNHMAWHRSQNDAFTWYTSEVLNGDHAGSYIVGTFGHEWKDFDGRDKFEAADGVDAAASMGATQSGSQQAFYLYRPDMSRHDAAAQGPPNMSSVTFFHLKPEGVNDFTSGVMKVKAAQDKSKWPWHSDWYQLANGGEGPTFVLVQPRANWAAFQAPDKTLDTLMEESYGKKEGAAILASLRQAIRTTYSEAIRYRPDLSYIPGAK
jgi:hypothetical protein